MGKVIMLRGVEEDFFYKVKVRAAEERIPMKDYILNAVRVALSCKIEKK